MRLPQVSTPPRPFSRSALPPPEGKRTSRLMLSFDENEMAMIQAGARERGEQSAVLCRTVEQQRSLLEAFAIE